MRGQTGTDFSLRHSKHEIVETLVDTAGYFQLNFPNGLSNGRQHGPLIGVAMTFDHHALETEQTGTVVSGRIHQLQKPTDNRTGQQADQSAVEISCEGLFHQLYEETGNTLAGFQGYIADKAITDEHIGDVPEQIATFHITDVVDGVALGQHV